MIPGEFIEVFDTVAEARGGVDRLRELVLQLAVRGRLVSQDADEELASRLIERIADEKSRWLKEGKRRTSKPLPPIVAEEIPFAVPDQWEWVRLGDIAGSRLGKMLDKSKNKGPYRRYLRNANVQWFRFDLSDVLELRLEDAELEGCSVKENDLVVCEGGEPGRAAVCGPVVDGMVFQKALHRVRPWCGISTWYLAYLLRYDTWSQRINSLFTGATIKHLTGKALATYMVPLPPLSEQYRIVAKVDELMGLIDRLEAARRSRKAVRTAGRDSALAALRNAATPEEVGTAWTRIAKRMDELFTAPADLAPLREAVLQLAVRGRLVSQVADDEPAAMLLERILSEAKHAPKSRVSVEYEPDIVSDMPCTWESVYIGDAMALVNGRAFKPGDWSTTGLPIVRIQNLNDPSAPFNYCSFSVAERFYIDTGALLLSWSGTPGTSFGAYIWNGGRAVLNQHIFRCEPHGEAFFVPYLRLAINSRLSKMIERAHGGVGLRHITKGQLQGLRLALPPFAEQHRIVAKVDELMALIDRLEQHLVAKEGIQGDFAVALAKRRVEATSQ